MRMAPDTMFGLLPEFDRNWILDNDVGLILPLRDSEGRMPWVVSLGRPARGWAFTHGEREFLEAVAPVAALALENCAFRSSPDTLAFSYDKPAGQCGDCRRVHAHVEARCVCGGPVLAAPLPFELNGKFRLIEEAGRGGMGIVYRASDLTLQRDVALKTLPLVSAEHSVRLRSEARSMAALSHAHLALIFGVESWRGTPVLVLEYLAGGTLAARIAHGVLPPDEALDVCSENRGRARGDAPARPAPSGRQAQQRGFLFGGHSEAARFRARAPPGRPLAAAEVRTRGRPRESASIGHGSLHVTRGHGRTTRPRPPRISGVWLWCSTNAWPARNSSETAVQGSRDSRTPDPFPGLEDASCRTTRFMLRSQRS